jgi:hypothetical protein
MDLQSRKLSFIQEFLRIQNEEIICSLENLLKKSKADIYDQNQISKSVEILNSEIDHSMEDSDNDRVISSSDLLEETENWK